jgi:probable 2-oxoglutarate dehydrogenase E1 component DHKTD1
MHSPSKTERLWFSHILEARSSSSSRSRTPALPGAAQKKRIHTLLAQSETFDQFLQLKFPNLKRYGLEGGESMIPALDTLFSVAAQGSYFSILIRVHFVQWNRTPAGVQHIVLAMPHRGRLNLLTGLLQMPPASLFHKVKGGCEFPEELGIAGDVISHLGTIISTIFYV